MLPGTELEFESKEYEDVMNKENEVTSVIAVSHLFIYFNFLKMYF